MSEVKPVQLNQFVVTQPSAPVEQEKPVEKKSLTTPQKAMIGLAVLGATIAAGLGIRHGINVKQFNESYDRLYKTVSNAIEFDKKSKHPEWFDYDALATKFNQAAKQAKEGRNLDDMKFYDEYLINCKVVFFNRNNVLEKLGEHIDVNKFDAHIKAILEEAEKSKSVEKFVELCSDLGRYKEVGGVGKGILKVEDKDYFKTVDILKSQEQARIEHLIKARIGSTVEESIEKTFGKNSEIKPHTYDLAKEGDELDVQINWGGFREGSTLKKGAKGSIRSYNFLAEELPKGANRLNASSYQNGVNLEEFEYFGKKVLRMRFPYGEVDTLGNRIMDTLVLSSKNRGYTPAQQDLMKVAEHLTEKDFECLRMAIDQPVAGNYKGFYEFPIVDFDVVLSSIQHIAGK